MNKKVINLEEYKKSEAGTYLSIGNIYSPSIAKMWLEEQDTITGTDRIIDKPYGTLEEYTDAEAKLVPLLDKLQGDKKELIKFIHMTQSLVNEVITQSCVIDDLVEDLDEVEDN